MKSPAIHRTPLYRAKAAYANMKRRCVGGNAHHEHPSYKNVELRMTLQEWLKWSIPLYTDFITKHPSSRPSVSRYEDSGHYEIGNLEIESFKQNRKRQKRPMQLRSDGTKKCGRCRIVKEARRFSKKSSNLDGLDRWCKSCKNRQAKIYRKNRNQP